MRKQVADKAGVSEATVSRVFSGSEAVKPKTRERVLQAASELGYVPSELARQFAKRRSGNIGVVLPYLPKVQLFSTYYFSEILGGISEAARELGSDLLLLQRSPDERREYGLLFRQRKVGGLIVLGARDGEEEREALLELERDGHAYALVNQRMEGLEQRTVEADHREGSRLATAHLLEQGWSRPAFVGGPPDYSNSRDRLLGYRDAMSAAGAERLEPLVGNYSRKSGLEMADAAARLIRSGEADALAAANDRMAIGLLQGMRQLGLEAGRDYGLAGYDDSDGARLTQPALTSVSASFYEMGRLAARMALGELERPDRKLPPRLVVRESSLKRDVERN
ncbi:LacI family DNA-binding transcriptional regulator [Paenibacillus sp. B01]|uniref:LacI family DNA-binding transcriptional regulator n=1 Tax=Paenibacillus sp. B01 TaxID=2660554 RepID=UPI00129A1D55|nr:LacI family DNA-binding transcriptional regulator [Paenibacillus sp. B01]QGG55365.1 LacI family DNA-binding transcriptional regulator [Paenibacillus sp. B01]